jgi:4-diphosphocytidyl-2-C-methyl-D-erythritol kinase
LIVFPNAKINLGLAVNGKRSDGFHELTTVFYPIGLSDILEVVRADRFAFTCTGLPIQGNTEDNLCVRIWKKLSAAYELPAVAIHLHKNIPMGAGLGGGSSDGAFFIRLIDQLFELSIPESKQQELALELGSDCPFFLLNRPALARGRGEILRPLELPQLKGKTIALINPGVHIGTAWAFNELALANSDSYRASDDFPPIQQLSLTEWKDRLINDFESLVFNAYPEIATIKEKLYSMGAYYASMTGTGSTVFGIFDQLPADWKSAFPASWQLIESK